MGAEFRTYTETLVTTCLVIGCVQNIYCNALYATIAVGGDINEDPENKISIESESVRVRALGYVVQLSCPIL